MEFYPTRDEMLDLIPTNSRIVEIGVFTGDFAKIILARRSPSKLFLIDPWDGISVSGDVDGNNVRQADLEEAFRKLKICYAEDPRVRLIRGRSPPALAEVVKDLSFNFVDAVYIDGDHSYEGVRKDLNACLRIVRPGGWIMGHDYAINPAKTNNRYEFGVKRAVDEFCSERKLKIHALALDGCVSYAIKVPEWSEIIDSGWGC